MGWEALHGERVALLSNPTGLLADLTHVGDSMVAGGVELVALLGPEHGFRGSARDGLSEADAVDSRTRVPVFDCYHHEPADYARTLRDVAASLLVIDLQDVGARFYTYIWSMCRAVEGAEVAGVRVLVLDRPNPLGRLVDGPGLQPGFESFIGLRDIPLRHGQTIGELAHSFGAHVDVIGCQDWDGELWPSTGRVWVPPSPNLPTFTSALVYPGTGLVEAVNLSEGRGTTRPFEVIGAPYVDHRLAGALNDAGLAGVRFRDCVVTPMADQYAGTVIGAAQIHVTDTAIVDPLALGVHVLCAARDLYPHDFSHRGDDWRWLGLMTGSDTTRDALVGGASADDILTMAREHR